MRGCPPLSVRNLSVLTFTSAVLLACGSSVEHAPASDGAGAHLDARESYLDAIDDAPEIPTCAHLGEHLAPDLLPEHHTGRWDGGCYVELSEEDHWTTLCQGTACHCLLNGEPLCACETEVPWCEVPSASCCPSPWP